MTAAAALGRQLGNVPLRLSVDLPLPALTVRELRDLKPGQVLCSTCSVADDLVLAVGAVPLFWGRFAAADGRMMLRVERLA